MIRRSGAARCASRTAIESAPWRMRVMSGPTGRGRRRQDALLRRSAATTCAVMPVFRTRLRAASD